MRNNRKAAALSLVFALCCTLFLCGCAEKNEDVSIDVNAAYELLLAADNMPEMIVVPADKAELLLGVSAEDCVQAVTAICQVSIQADEIWLVEAKDADAAGRVAELAQNRIDQKSAELENYLPEQFKVVQDARLIRNGNIVVLIISPQAEQLCSILKDNYNIG